MVAFSVRDAITSIHEIAAGYAGENDLSVPGGRQVCNLPWVAPLAYLHRFFPSVGDEGIASIAVTTGRQPHADFRDLLSIHNGMHLFNGSIAIFGVRHALTRAPEEAIWLPFDLGTPNIDPGALLGRDEMVIGSIGPDRNALVCRADAGIDRMDRETGERLETWASLAEMLLSEATRLAKYYDPDGRMVPGQISDPLKAEPCPTDPLLPDPPSKSPLRRLFNAFGMMRE